MFKQRLNELRLTLRLTPAGPLLVKAGEDPAALLAAEAGTRSMAADFDQLYQRARHNISYREERIRALRDESKLERARQTGDERALREKLDLDMRFVATRRPGKPDPEVYLPGSGLKGVLRSRAEQLTRTLLPHVPVCDIFAEDQPATGLRSCTKTVPEKDSRVVPPVERYARACRICQLFGCGGLAGRLSVSDAYLLPEPKPMFGTRSGVGIDRYRGAAASGALFFYQVLERGMFEFTLTLENFELWQAGLLAFALHDLLHGELPIGYGARRGLGRVRGEAQTAWLTYFGIEPHTAGAGCALLGVTRLTADPSLAGTYGWAPEPDAPPVLAGARLQTVGLRQEWMLGQEDLEALWAAGAAAWRKLPSREETHP